MAAIELGSHHNQIARWFRELQHYGFIVLAKPGFLGVEGKGQAPRWRLTELGCMKELPTRDFERWDGTPFVDQKKPVQEKAHGVCSQMRTLLCVKTARQIAILCEKARTKETEISVSENKHKTILPLAAP
jgi:hypothetical protein